MSKISAFLIISMWFFNTGLLKAQLSPGKLAAPHTHLEGLSNCTKCHILGSKLSNDKCLECHKELRTRISENAGYHVSSEVKGKLCSSCHSDHHGTTFKMVRFEPEKFNHNLTGYKLAGAHAKLKCYDCHRASHISSNEIKAKKFTWLGLNTKCTTCHDDYHQTTLGNSCSDCHNDNAFKPAALFNHDKSNYKLLGKHQEVECLKCHPVTFKEGKKFQQFKGLQYQTCKSCHKDPHENKFGADCAHCHSYESFKAIKTLDNFDHTKTNYKLENKHLNVACKSCHKTNYTNPLKHEKCIDCHTDYHQNQFDKQGVKPDCAQCHTTKGFPGSLYTLEKHNESTFPLQGAHIATPCNACHKKQEKWNFRNIGKNCVDCHKDFHDTFIDKKYYPEAECKACHSVDSWSKINFDHNKTQFKLTGVHIQQTCRKCHFKTDKSGAVKQLFSVLEGKCIECHADKHYNQFEVAGITDCSKCHNSLKWKIDNFDHNKAAFKLDGKHINVPCSKCHTNVNNGQNTYVLYKIKKFQCKDCH